ncbi:hypothetical protein K1T71_015216 [Dendrolimus kikuchii]|nr:hypothetical protein K1T71_015216 [Dendrolimus kikuchii]
MTVELLKDTILKLTHAKKLQEFYEGSITYELGTISAGIREKYMEMVKIYKENANVSHFRIDSSSDTVTNSLHQLAIVQGNYMEIKQEYQMFTAIVEAYERKALEQQKRLNKKSGRSRLRMQIGRTAGYSNIRALTEKKSARRYKDIWEEDWKKKHDIKKN